MISEMINVKNDVIMGSMVSQITSLTTVSSTVYSGVDHKKYQSSASLCEGNSPVTGEFPTQRASNAVNFFRLGFDKDVYSLVSTWSDICVLEHRSTLSGPTIPSTPKELPDY